MGLPGCSSVLGHRRKGRASAGRQCPPGRGRGWCWTGPSERGMVGPTEGSEVENCLEHMERENDHPATRAWRHLRPEASSPTVVETLKSKGHSLVYRLH